MRLRLVLRILLALAVSAGLLALLLSRVDAAEALRRLGQADPASVLLAGGLYAGTVAMRGQRFHVLARGAPRSVVSAAIAVQQVFLRVLPLRLGELALPWILTRQRAQQASHALLGLVLVRLLDLVVVAAALVAGALLRAGRTDPAVLIPASLLLLVLLVVLLAYRPAVHLALALARRVAAFTGLLRRERLAGMLDRLAGAAHDLDGLPRGSIAALVLWSVAIYVVQSACFGVLLLAYGIQATVLQLAIGSSAAQLGAAVPVASVGSVGTLEAGWAAGFAWAGISLPDAVASAIGAQVLTMVYCLVLAAPAWLWLSRRARTLGPAAQGAGARR
jgi:uncharacterized membrane protein YbhN (UPF0104 family)